MTGRVPRPQPAISSADACRPPACHARVPFGKRHFISADRERSSNRHVVHRSFAGLTLSPDRSPIRDRPAGTTTISGHCGTFAARLSQRAMWLSGGDNSSASPAGEADLLDVATGRI